MQTNSDQLMGYMEGKWPPLVIALATFVIDVSTSQKRTVNGVVVQDITLNYVAVAAGPLVVILCAVLAWKLSRQAIVPGSRPVHYAILAGIAAIGVYHFLTSGFVR